MTAKQATPQLSFEQQLERIALFFREPSDTFLLICVCDDARLREFAVSELQKKLGPRPIQEFRYTPEKLDLLAAAATQKEKQSIFSCVALEELSRENREKAIQTLNNQRNRLGNTGASILFWCTDALLKDLSNGAPDFYSWRSATIFLPVPAGWDAEESQRRAYLQSLRAQYRYHNLQGIAPIRGNQVVQVLFEKIFALPSFLEKQTEHIIHSLLNELSKFGDPQRDEKPQQSFINRAAELHDLGKYDPFFQKNLDLVKIGQTPKKASLEEILSSHCSVILGDPGSGKSTLLRYFAYSLACDQLSSTSQLFPSLALAKKLPIYVRLGEYAQFCQQHPNCSLEEYLQHCCKIHQLLLTPTLIQKEAAAGNVLFLLDGLDEVLHAAQRIQISQQVEKLSRSYPMCYFLVTSRVVGYQEAALGHPFMTFTAEPFSPEQIRQFAQNWYTALGKPKDAQSLIDAVQGNASIQKLASNPLLLTVLALLHWRGTKLPRYRVTLYQLAADTLLNYWMEHRQTRPQNWDERVASDVLLPAIAWHMHRTTSSGLLDEVELQVIVTRALREHQDGLDEASAKRIAEEFCHNVSEFSGIFLERGLGSTQRRLYGFLHLTFEEYFAAIQLTKEWGTHGKASLRDLLHDPRWQEVILLAAGHLSEHSGLGEKLTTDFLKDIWSAKSKYEEILHRDKMLVGRCLGDQARCSSRQRNHWLASLVDLHIESAGSTALQADLELVLRGIAEREAPVEPWSCITKYLPSRPQAVNLLGKLGEFFVPESFTSILVTLLDDSSLDVRELAAIWLVQKGLVASKPLAIPVLVSMHSFTVGDSLRELSLRGFSKSIIDALLHKLKDKDEGVRLRALSNLGGPSFTQSLEVKEAIVAASTQDSSAAVRTVATNILLQGEDIDTQPEFVPNLLKILSSPDWQTSSFALRVLMGSKSAETKQKMISVLAKNILSKDKEVANNSIIHCLYENTLHNPEIIAAVVKRLADEDAQLRRVAVQALQRINFMTPLRDIEILMLALLEDPDWEVRKAAANALVGMKSHNTDKAILVLLSGLHHKITSIRANNISTLGSLGESATKEVFEALLALQRKSTQKEDLSATIGALVSLVRYTPNELRAQVEEVFVSAWDSRQALQTHIESWIYLGLRDLATQATGLTKKTKAPSRLPARRPSNKKL
jgi:HEAT repeat protein